MIQQQIHLNQRPAAPLLEQVKTLWRDLNSAFQHPFAPILKSINTPQVEDWVKATRDFAFDRYVVLGTGGASLGGQTLAAFQGHPRKVTFLENIDPHTMRQTLASLDLETTGFIVISKSGQTSETLAQFLIVYDYVKAHLGSASGHFLGITTDHNSPLQDLFKALMVTWVKHPADVGGRFSAFTAVGMIPVLLAGLPVIDFFKGAQDVIANPNDALEGAGFAFQHHEQRHQHVMMAYGDRLSLFTLWFRQLWAESLGKDGKGSTPIPALGTVDQHSQLQLFSDGPDDKVYSFITVDYKGQGPVILRPGLDLPGLDFFKNKTLGDLMAAEQQATYQSLLNRGRPIRGLHLKTLDAYHLGALMAHFMIETVLMAALMGIDAFSQPGVEDSKMLTKTYLSEG